MGDPEPESQNHGPEQEQTQNERPRTGGPEQDPEEVAYNLWRAQGYRV